MLSLYCNEGTSKDETEGVIVMMGKTHTAIGIASAFLVMQPRTHSALAAALIGGAIGGVMSDIDVKIDRSIRNMRKPSMDAVYGELSSIMIAVAALFSDGRHNGTIVPSIIDNGWLALIGLIVFGFLTVIGKTRSEHRGRTHSLLACLLFTVSVMLVHPVIGVAFGIGYCSHLCLDLLNKTPVRLFYPLQKGICFKVCYANRLGNEILFSLGTAFCVFYMLSVIV